MDIRPFVTSKRWFLGALALTLLFILIWLIWTLGFETDWRARLKTQALLVISSMLVALLGGWFLDIFTGEATKEKFEQMVAYCYVFPFICLGGTVLPFFAFPDVLPYPPDERYPIGIVLGCSQPPARPAKEPLQKSTI